MKTMKMVRTYKREVTIEVTDEEAEAFEHCWPTDEQLALTEAVIKRMDERFEFAGPTEYDWVLTSVHDADDQIVWGER